MARYTFEFYEMTLAPCDDFQSAFEALSCLESGDGSLAVSDGGFTRELWALESVGNGNAQVIRGMFRKFRMSDLPETGAVGRASEPLDLDDDEGLVEKNFFSLYKNQSLLVWHANGHANTAGQFQRAVSELAGAKVEVHPIIQKDAMKRLMRGAVELRSLAVSVPRPKDPSYYPETDFNKHLFEMLAGSSGDRIRVQVTTNATTNDNPTLRKRVKSAIKELVTDGMASRAKVQVIEDGIQHPIDLIADRIKSQQEITHDGRYPLPAAMYRAIDSARHEEQAAINAILGDPDEKAIG